MQKTKLTLLDKDGTIVSPRSNSKFVQKPWDQQPLPGAKEAIAHYHREGWLIIGLSNYGNILEEKYTIKLFPKIKQIYFCPDSAGKGLWMVSNKDIALLGAPSFFPYLKPAPGMLNYCLRDFNARAKDCWLLGDSKSEQAAEAADVNFMPGDIWCERFRVPHRSL